MILTLKQEKYVQQIVDELCAENKDIEWVLREEERKYINTRYENVCICLGHGKLDHFENLDDFEETYHYYSSKKQLLYFIVVSRTSDTTVRIVVHRCKDGGVCGSHKIDQYTKTL